MLEDPKIRRLKELSKIDYPSDQEIEELAQLKEELELSDQDLRQKEDPIGPIEKYRKRMNQNKAMAENLAILRAKRKELQLQLDTRKEKERLEKIKNQLDGKIWCDDCHAWFYPSHFE